MRIVTPKSQLVPPESTASPPVNLSPPVNWSHPVRLVYQVNYRLSPEAFDYIVTFETFAESNDISKNDRRDSGGTLRQKETKRRQTES